MEIDPIGVIPGPLETDFVVKFFCLNLKIYKKSIFFIGFFHPVKSLNKGFPNIFYKSKSQISGV